MHNWFWRFIAPISHVVTAYIIAVYAFAVHDVPLSWWMLVSALLFGLLPDIDSTRSILGRRVRWVSSWLESEYGHRTVTHSIWPVLAIGIICYLTSWLVNWSWWMPAAMYASHIILDMIIGTTGVPLLYPEPTRYYLFKRFRAGGVAERLVTIALIVSSLVMLTSGLPNVSAMMQRSTGSLDYAIAQYREWQPYYQVLVELEATDQTTNELIGGVFPVIRVQGKTFIIEMNGVQREAGQADQELYIRRVVAQRGETVRPTQPTAAPTPTFIATIVSIKIDHVFDMPSELLIGVGDVITKSQQLADLHVLRATLAAPTSTPTPTYIVILAPSSTPAPTATPTPAPLIQPTQRPMPQQQYQKIRPLSEFDELVSKANANLNLSIARATQAAAIIPQPTIDAVCQPVDTSTYAADIEAAQGQIHIAQLRLDDLLSPPPVATVTACESTIENMRNSLWASQLSRDSQVQSDPDMSWTKQKALEAPLLEKERQIAEKVIECQQLGMVQRSGSDIEIASAQAQIDAANLRLAASQKRYNEAVQRVHTQADECTNMRSWPYVASPEQMNVSAAQLQVAYENHAIAIATWTPVSYWTAVPTWTPIPTWTPTKTPTVTPTRTGTPTATPTPDTSDTFVYSPVGGDVYAITVGTFDENGASVTIEIATGYGRGESVPGAPGQPITGSSIPLSGSGSIEAFFTKNGVDIEQLLIQRIDAAQSTIDIASFEFNLPRVADALIAATQRGVVIRFKTDDDYGLHHDELKLFPKLSAAGVQVRDDNRGALMHNKFWLFDSRVTWTGSTNITTNGTQKNNNNVIVFSSPEVIAIFQQEFDEMWAGQHGPKSPSQLSQQSVVLDGIPVQVVFGPEDEGIKRLVSLVNSAEESIRFMAFSFTHDALGEAMQDAATRTGDVMGIFEARSSKTVYSELGRLHCESIAKVRRDGNSRTFHHKAIVVDGRIVATGSFNFSANANDNNDENFVIVESVELAQAYLAEFDRRWAEAKVSDVECK